MDVSANELKRRSTGLQLDVAVVPHRLTGLEELFDFYSIRITAFRKIGLFRWPLQAGIANVELTLKGVLMQKEAVVRAVDVGRKNTKYTARVTPTGVKCAMFPSLALPFEGPVPDKTAVPDAATGDTVDIPVDGLMYKVGPDVQLAAGPFTAQVLQHDRYCESPEYLALTLGALYYMNVERIDLLVVGLPVRTTKQPQVVQALQKRLRGKHELGNGRTVHVARVETIAQPAGSLMYSAALNKRGETMLHQKNLVIDFGSRTFDWIFARGMQPVVNRSDSVPLGMYDVYAKIAEGVSRNLKIDFNDYDAIDLALRGVAPLTIFQQQYPIEKHLAIAKKIPQQAVSEMLRYIGGDGEVNNVTLTAGGAFFAMDVVAAAFPRHKVDTIKNSIFANVNGFWTAGMHLMKTTAPALSEDDYQT